VANNIFSDIGVNRALMVNEAGEMARKRIERLVGEFAALHTRVIKIKFEILEGEKRQEEEDLRSESAKERARKAQQIGTIVVDDEHQFWPFTGEYWRDELGYYRYKLMNKCGRMGQPDTAAPEPAPGGGDGTGTGGEGVQPESAPAPATQSDDGISTQGPQQEAM
jgi:hypothetical protein